MTEFNNFTQSEKERIDQLYGSEFANATPDDYQLIARWEHAKAYEDAKADELSRVKIAECQARLEQANAETELAFARLAAITGGDAR